MNERQDLLVEDILLQLLFFGRMMRQHHQEAAGFNKKLEDLQGSFNVVNDQIKDKKQEQAGVQVTT